MSTRLITLVLFLLSVATAASSADTEVTCQVEYQRLEADSGYLLISRSQPRCGFLSKNSDFFFAIKTGDLRLKGGDKLSIHPTTDANYTKVFEPPFDDGYIVSGVKEPIIEFDFANPDNTSMRVAFMQNSTSIPINGDINNDFTIDMFGVKSLNFVATKTVQQPIHLQLEGASFKETSLRHKIINSPGVTISLDIVGNPAVVVKTSPVLANCSDSIVDKTETDHALVGPDTSVVKKPYKCVQLFHSDIQSKQSHYEVNLKSFVDLVDSDDELIIDGPDNHIKITRSIVNAYAGQTYSLIGTDLAVIYNSPRYVQPTQTKFSLTVSAKGSGGIFDKPGKLTLPPTGSVLFVLEPGAKQYATVEFEFKSKQLKGCDLTVSSNGKTVVKFSEGTYLPPTVGLSQLGASMSLKISGKDLSPLKDTITFKPVNSSCHKIGSGSFSVVGALSVCHWTIPASSNIGLNIDYNDLGLKGCLTIRPLAQDKPIFDKCDLSKNDVLPAFIVKQALVSVTLPNNSSRLDASLSTSPFVTEATLEPSDRVVIASSGYPVSYPWSSEKQVMTLNSAKKNYVMTFADVDLRTGEKLVVNQLDISNANRATVGDIFLPNNSSTIVTVVRQASTNDFGFRRGFNISARSFGQVIQINTNTNKFTTPKQLTSLFIKLTYSAAVQDIKEFANRIGYNITFSEAGKSFNFSIHDGRSTLGHRIEDTVTMFHGSTTSDTLLIVYEVNKPGTFLPAMTIEFTPLSCNSTKNDFVCDSNTRCVPAELMCHGKSYCDDKSDLSVACTAGPTPAPKVIETGVAGVTVFILCVLMLTIGAVGALYGPDLYEKRFRLGQYTTFTSTE